MKFAHLKFGRTCALLCLVAFALSGCGGGGGSSATGVHSQGIGKTSFTIKWPKRSRVIPMGANAIVIDMTSQFAPTETATSGPLVNPMDGSTITWTSNQLDVGTWTVTATAYPNADGSGVPLAAATVPVTITSSGTASLNMTMLSTATKLTVSGPTALAFSAGGTYIATVFDASNNVLLEDGTKISWQTSDSNILSPGSSSGSTITATAGTTAGTANLSATFTEVETGQTAPSGSVAVKVARSSSGSGGITTNFWTQFDGDLQNTGRSAEPTPGLNQAWRLPLTAARHISSGVMMDNNGLAYMLNQTGAANSWIMYGIDPGNQVILWQTPVTTSTAGGQEPKLLLSNDGVLYLANKTGILVFTTADGKPAGAFVRANNQNSYPIIGKDNLIYWGVDNHVLAINRSTLAIQHNFVAAGNVSQSMAFDPDGTLYVADDMGTLYSLNSGSNFSVNWKFLNNLLTPVPFVGGPAVMDNGTIVIGATNNVFHFIFKATGFEASNFQAAFPIVSTPAIGYDGTVFFSDDGGNLYALGPRSPASALMGTEPGINFPPIVYKDGGLQTFSSSTSSINQWVFTPGQNGAPGTWAKNPAGRHGFNTFGGVGLGIAPGNNLLMVTDAVSSVYALR